MGPLADLMQGFVDAATPMNLLMCFAGVLLGQIIGVLPGIGPSAAIALLLPLTYGSSPTGAIIMFAGLYYGAQYGGTLTSVLINVPGESSSVMTSIDGYKMATQGRGGLVVAIPRYFSSCSMSRPAAACGTYLIMPSVEAWARWAEPKASLT